jgi:hypothetical protein
MWNRFNSILHTIIEDTFQTKLASWDLPVIRRDDGGRSGNVVHNVGVEDDLQVLAAPVLGCLLHEFRDQLRIRDEITCGLSARLTGAGNCQEDAPRL